MRAPRGLELGRGVVGAGERDHVVAALYEACDERAADQAAAAGDEDGHCDSAVSSGIARTR